MNDAPLACTVCNTPLPAEAVTGDDLVPCRGCGTPNRAWIFPALYRPAAPGRTGESIVIESDAACFFHPRKKAEAVCEECGRFLCALCDTEIAGRRLCPPCIEKGEGKGTLEKLSTHRMLYDNLAMALAVYPLLFFFITCVTAPAALYVAIRYWKAPSSIVPRTKARHIFAMILASLQIAGWSVGLYALLS